MKNQKIDWIDGLKGIGCILIFVHHFLLAFYPATFYGESATSHVGFDKLVSESPLAVLINGNFIVHIFCVLSAIVITKGFQNKKKKEISDRLLKRYIHFLLLMVPIGIVTYLAIKFHFITNIEISKITKSNWLAMHYTQGLPFITMIQASFYGILFEGDYSISTAFWMMNYIFIGTYLIYILETIFYHRSKKSMFLLGIPLLGMTVNQNYLADFIMGFIIYQTMMKTTNIKKTTLNSIVGILCIVIGLFLGGYPSGVTPNNIYAFLSNQPIFLHHFIGASLLIIGIIKNKRVQSFFSMKAFKLISKISFNIYLLHILVLFSFGTTIFKELYGTIGKYNISALITFVSTLGVLIILSIGYHRYFEKELKKAEAWLIKKTYRKEAKKGK